MKALEKAAKDRGETQQTPPAASTVAAAAPTAAPATPAAAKQSAAELTLEPLSTKAASTPSAPTQQTGKTTARSDRDQQSRAATVMQASAAGISSGPRIRPVMAIGIVAGLVALALAIYVYLQITNPGLFIRQAPVPAKLPAPLAQAPAPAPQLPIATGAVMTPATQGSGSGAATAPSREAETLRPPRTPTSAQPGIAQSTEPSRNNIRISAGAAEPQLDPRLTQAYAALQSGKLDAARQLYGDTLRSEPRNINALLGLATIAMQENKTEEASRLYFNVLDLEPRNPYAQTGLVAILGRADPASAEAKLKQLITREPLASLHFTLGNLYGDQSRWAEAQQSYFQAHHLEPANPDYAYNLAVGLEHVGQVKLAVGFYRRAVAQAQARGRAGFDLKQAQDRIRQLTSQPE